MVVDELLLLLFRHALQRVVLPLELACQAVEGCEAHGGVVSSLSLLKRSDGPGDPPLLPLMGLGLDPTYVLYTLHTCA